MKLIIVGTICILAALGCSNKRAKENEKNIQKVKIGMSVRQVNGIMGKADTILKLPYDTLRFNYGYYSPNSSSDEFYIFFSIHDSTVVDIGKGE